MSSTGFWPLIKFVPAQTHFKFTRLAPVAAVISGIAVLASVASFFLVGLNLGTDFKGGVLMEVNTQGPAPLAQLREALGKAGVHDPQVQGFGAPNAAVLRFLPPEGADPAAGVKKLEGQLAAQFPGIQFKRADVVGAKVSSELFGSGLTALGIAIGLMLLYIWFRFQLQFGLGAVIAIFHDLILTVGILSALHIEFSMTSIAALLTIIGYSMNEKVITFDRLRENLRKYKRTSLRDIIDLSENERLSRTLITGSTALLALAGMLFFGGPTLFPLVFAMVFGIVIGTYSSIYVALPIILVWGVKRNDEEAKPLPQAPLTAMADNRRQPPSLDAYGGGGFRVAGVRHAGSILILDDKVQPWAVTSVAELTPDSLQAVFDAGLGPVEFVLLGIGPKVTPPPPAVRQALQSAGMGLEVMDTATACRLYNVLVSEGRRLACALIAI